MSRNRQAHDSPLKYDKEHEHELVIYEHTSAGLKTLLAEGEKITPKVWRTEREQLEKQMPTLRNERARRVTTLHLRK